MKEAKFISLVLMMIISFSVLCGGAGPAGAQGDPEANSRSILPISFTMVDATDNENDTAIQKIYLSDDIHNAYFDLSNRFRQMIQPSWIEYSGGGKSGKAKFFNSSTSSQPHKCGLGHVIYLCNRTFVFSNDEEYEMVVVKMDEDLNIIENTGWIKGTYTIYKNECAWFSIILRSADCTSVVNRLADVAAGLTVYVSEEEIDKTSDFPLVLGIVNFTSNGVMSVGSTFTTYTGFNTLGLAYPITNEERIEQTNRLSTWHQSLMTYDATNGAILQKPSFYNSMTWVDTLNNENLFVLWKKSDNSNITYAQAMEASENVTIKKLDDQNNHTWIMDLDANFRVSSHRIEAQLAPRNTYSALEFAYNRGYRWFESDIHLTKDLVPVMLHDRNIRYVSNGNVNIDSITYEEALQYDFGSWHSPRFAGEKILRLEDMLKFCAEHDCGLNLEFKSSSVPAWDTETIGIVYNLIKQYGMEDRVMFNGNGAEIAYLKIYLENYDDTAEVQWLPGSLTENNISTAKTLQTGKNVVRICVPWGDNVTKALVDRAKSLGILIDVHCVSSIDAINPSAYEEMVSFGIAGIITESANTTFYNEELHTHVYTSNTVAPTCNEQGFTTYICECGDSYVADFVDETGHSYENGICISCGEANLDNHVPGDINGDGSVNNKDLTRLFRYLTAYDVEVREEALDINGDGSVNNKDQTRLFRYLSGYPVEIY